MPIATMEVGEIFTPDKPLETLKCYGTSQLEHPGEFERGEFEQGCGHCICEKPILRSTTLQSMGAEYFSRHILPGIRSW